MGGVKFYCCCSAIELVVTLEVLDAAECQAFNRVPRGMRDSEVFFLRGPLDLSFALAYAGGCSSVSFQPSTCPPIFVHIIVYIG